MRHLEKDQKLRMTDDDYLFHENQKSWCTGKCLDIVSRFDSRELNDRVRIIK